MALSPACSSPRRLASEGYGGKTNENLGPEPARWTLPQCSLVPCLWQLAAWWTEEEAPGVPATPPCVVLAVSSLRCWCSLFGSAWASLC